METRPLSYLCAALLLLLLLSSAHALPSLLIFTKVSPGAYTHESIPFAIEIITQLGQGTLSLDNSIADPSLANSNAKWTVTHNDDDSLWEDGTYLNQFDAVAFLMTKWVHSFLAFGSEYELTASMYPSRSDVSPPNATTVFSNASADAFAKYIEQGGGYIGIHSASATAFLNPFYGRLVGAFFQYHPEIQQVGIKAINKDNPSTSRFPSELTIDEEVRMQC